MKRVFVKLKIRHGEYEFYSSSLHTVDDATQADTVAEDHAKDFYSRPEGGTDTLSGNCWYEFSGGEVAVCVEDARDITEAEYSVLKEFI